MRAFLSYLEFPEFFFRAGLHRSHRSLVLRLSPALTTPPAGLRNSVKGRKRRGLFPQTVLEPSASRRTAAPVARRVPERFRKARLWKRFRPASVSGSLNVIAELHLRGSKNSGNSRQNNNRYHHVLRVGKDESDGQQAVKTRRPASSLRKSTWRDLL